MVKNEPVGGLKNSSKTSNLSDANARLNGSHEVLITKRGSNSNSDSNSNSNGENGNGENGNEGDEMVMGGYDEGEDMDEGGHMDEDDGDD